MRDGISANAMPVPSLRSARRNVDLPPLLPVMLLISSLEQGGAERQVLELCSGLDRTRFRPFVCVLNGNIPLAERLAAFERDVVLVEKRCKYDISTIWRVAAVMRRRHVAVVHAFLFDAEIVARLAAPIGGGPVVVASERNTDYQRRRVQTLCLQLTGRLFDVMIANSEAGKRFNVRTLGIEPGRIVVIRNAVNVQLFRSTNSSAVRRELGIPLDAPVVGMVASFKRQKRYEDFFAVAQRVLARYPEAWFMAIGEPLRDNHLGAADYHREMLQLATDLGVAARIRFLGGRADMPDVYSACDATVLTSAHEGTPNVLLESMACEVPVVATAVSDAAQVVPDRRAGFLVPVGAVDTMAECVLHLLSSPRLRREFGRAGREWVAAEFAPSVLAHRTERVYLKALERRRGTALA